MDYFWAGIKVRQIFRGLLIHTNNFCFMNFALLMLYLQFTFFLWRDGQTRVHKEAPPELKKRYSVKNIYLWQE